MVFKLNCAEDNMKDIKVNHRKTFKNRNATLNIQNFYKKLTQLRMCKVFIMITNVKLVWPHESQFGMRVEDAKISKPDFSTFSVENNIFKIFNFSLKNFEKFVRVAYLTQVWRKNSNILCLHFTSDVGISAQKFKIWSLYVL